MEAATLKQAMGGELGAAKREMEAAAGRVKMKVVNAVAVNMKVKPLGPVVNGACLPRQTSRISSARYGVPHSASGFEFLNAALRRSL